VTLIRMTVAAVFAIGLWACCGNEDEVRVPSPDRKHTAYSYLRNCGATTDYVSIVELEAPGFSRGAPVYRANGTQRLHLRWLSSKELVIECAACPPRDPTAPPIDGITITVTMPDPPREGVSQ